MSQDKRLTNRLIAYWDLIRKENPVPSYNNLNQNAIHDLWKQSMVMQSIPAFEKMHFQILHVGDKVEELVGNDMVGKQASPANFNHIARGKLINKIDEVAQNPFALQDEGKFVNHKSKVVRYRACLLPFGADEKNITHILTGLSWREF